LALCKPTQRSVAGLAFPLTDLFLPTSLKNTADEPMVMLHNSFQKNDTLLAPIERGDEIMSRLSEQMLTEFEELPDNMQREVIDFVQFLKSKRQKQEPYNGQQLLTLLKEGRQHNLFAGIKDPVAWQKEIRADRPLPGRE